jgi:hypothetical protein
MTRRPTRMLRPWTVRDPDIVVLTRQDANKKKQLASQLHAEVQAAIRKHLKKHPVPSNMAIARWVKNDPKTKPHVTHLTVRSLADKVGEVRRGG